MASETEVRIGELVEHAIGGGWGSDEPTPGSTEVAVIRGADFPSFKLEPAGVPRRFEKASKVPQRTLRHGDIVLEISGGTKDRSTGRTVYISQEALDQFGLPVIPASFCRLLRVDTTKADPLYVYYWLQEMHTSGRAWLYQVQSTGLSNFQFKHFLETEVVRLPPIEEQRAIAEVLSALDDRITYLGERIRLAHATILSWYDSLGASSFPSAPLGSVIDVVGGSTPSTKQPMYWGGEHCWVTPKDLSEQQSPVVLRSTRKLTDAGVNKISSGLLPEGTVLLSSRAPIGYVAVAHVPLAINQGFIALPPSDVACPAYVVGWLHRSMQLIKGRAGGSTFAEISKRNFKPIEFPVPRGPAYEQFRQGADELYDLIADAERERQTTVQLRAVLLPRLLSGEVRIEDPARVLGAVA